MEKLQGDSVSVYPSEQFPKAFAPGWLSAGADISYESPEESLGFDAILRMQLDQKAWASLRKFGIEVARMQADSAGVTVLNRIEKEFIYRDWSAISRELGYPMDFALMQTLLLGNVPLGDQARWNLRCDSIQCSWLSVVEGAEWSLQMQHADPAAYLLHMADRASQASLHAILQRSAAFGRAGAMPLQRDYSFENQKTGKIRVLLKLEGIEIDQAQKMPFDIPASYKRVP